MTGLRKLKANEMWGLWAMYSNKATVFTRLSVN